MPICNQLINALLESWAQSEPLDIGFIDGASGSFVAGAAGGVVGTETVYDLYDFEMGDFWYAGSNSATSIGASGNAYAGVVQGWSSFPNGGVTNYAGASVSFGGGVGAELFGISVQGFAGEKAQLRGFIIGGSIGPSLDLLVSISGSVAKYTKLGVKSFHMRGPRQQTREDAVAFVAYLMSMPMSPALMPYRSVMSMFIIRNGMEWHGIARTVMHGRNAMTITKRPLRLKVLLLAVMLLIFTVWACYLFTGPSATSQRIPQAGDSDGYLRGGAVVVVRLPTERLPIDQIQIFEDRHASRAFIPLPDPWASIQMTLPDQTWQDVEVLRQTWCAQPPTLHALAESETFYEIALKCGPGFNTPVFNVPSDQLPPALMTLLATLPPAPSKGSR